tara:strand:+ start:19077 stop:20438 length:1362 start_codon:yes stop_codon:yes gene_type:complete
MSLVLALLGLGIAAILTIFNSSSDRIVRPTFLFSGVHALYIFPKILALSVSISPAARYFQASGTDVTVAYMALLCYLGFILFYELLAPKPAYSYGNGYLKMPTKRTTNFAIIVGGSGFLAFLALIARNGGLYQYYFDLSFYQAELTGVNVWLIFLSRFTYPAIAAIALLAALRPSRFSLSLLALLSMFPLMNVLFLFRRSDLLLLGFIAIYALTASGRIRLNRVFVLVGMGVMFLSISLFPYLRQDNIYKMTSRSHSAEVLSVQERLADSLEVDVDDEIVRAASTIDNAYKSGHYGLGTFIWDSLVNQFVPATLVGQDTKNSLYLGNSSTSGDGGGYFDEQAFFYVAPMGFAQAYEQFGPLGWTIFSALGALIALIERKSSKLSNLVFVIIAIPIVCLAATNDIGSTPARLVTFWILTRFLGKARWRTYRNRNVRKTIESRIKITPIVVGKRY